MDKEHRSGDESGDNEEEGGVESNLRVAFLALLAGKQFTTAVVVIAGAGVWQNPCRGTDGRSAPLAGRPVG